MMWLLDLFNAGLSLERYRQGPRSHYGRGILDLGLCCHHHNDSTERKVDVSHKSADPNYGVKKKKIAVEKSVRYLETLFTGEFTSFLSRDIEERTALNNG